MKDNIKNIITTIHHYGLWVIIALTIGGYCGAIITKKYYDMKTEDFTKTGAFVYKDIVYTVAPR